MMWLTDGQTDRQTDGRTDEGHTIIRSKFPYGRIKCLKNLVFKNRPFWALGEPIYF